MTTLVLQRLSMTKDGTFGVLMLNDRPLCVTLEDPWNNNAQNISCIPAGVYKCVRHNGAKYKNVWRLLDVPNRTAILIHSGNTTKDTQGCVLVGQSFGDNAIIGSKAALDKLRSILPEEFSINIRNPR